MGPKAGPVMARQETVTMKIPKEKEPAVRRAKGGKAVYDAEDPRLFEVLRALRAKIART